MGMTLWSYTTLTDAAHSEEPMHPPQDKRD